MSEVVVAQEMDAPHDGVVMVRVRHRFSVLLKPDTDKPIKEMSDEFWQRFCTDVLYDMKRFSIRGALDAILCIYLAAQGVVLIMVRFYVCIAINFASMVLLLYRQLICSANADARVDSLLRTLNVHCGSHFHSHIVNLAVDEFRTTGNLRFERMDSSTLSLFKKIEEQKVAAGEGKDEFRLYFGMPSNMPDHEIGNHFVLGGKQMRPLGVSSLAWSLFCSDILEDVSKHDKNSRRVKLLFPALCAMCAPFSLIGALTILMAMLFTLLSFNYSFHYKMRQKFAIIEKYGSSLFGPTYHQTYQAVRWYSWRDNYVLFKRARKGKKE